MVLCWEPKRPAQALCTCFSPWKGDISLARPGTPDSGQTRLAWQSVPSLQAQGRIPEDMRAVPPGSKWIDFFSAQDPDTRLWDPSPSQRCMEDPFQEVCYTHVTIYTHSKTQNPKAVGWHHSVIPKCLRLCRRSGGQQRSTAQPSSGNCLCQRLSARKSLP